MNFDEILTSLLAVKFTAKLSSRINFNALDVQDDVSWMTLLHLSSYGYSLIWPGNYVTFHFITSNIA